MALDAQAIIREIDEVLAIREGMKARSKFDDLSDLKGELEELAVLLAQAIDRFAPAGSTYKKTAEAVFNAYGATNPHYTQVKYTGILQALRRAYASGYFQSVQELVHAEVFSDFLEMAEYLLTGGFKDPAAVLAGGVLEEGLRKLCVKNGIPTADGSGQPKKASVMNDELAKAKVYEKLEQKSVNAWLDLRNKAAHGRHAEYDQNQVAVYLEGIRGFLMRHPA
jgi:hypothetical protein